MSDAIPGEKKPKIKKARKKKPPFLTRLANRGRELKALGGILVNQPKAFPAELLKFLRRSLRTVWDARGGGLYACGFIVTFIYLEVRMFIDDVVDADSVGGYFSEQLGELLFKYIGESFRNTISAFIWPVNIVEIYPPWGVVALGGMFFIFPAVLKKPLERWLFGAEDR